MASYKISEIEGIGPQFAAKLQKAGVRSVNDLLKKGAAAKGRKAIAAASGIDQKMILKWVNMADLFRIKGIGQEYSELLEKAGVDTVKELRNRNADNLHAKMAEVNSAGRALVRQLPGKKSVESWVAQAKKMDPKVTY
jgi:predicted flap endonuclease-1-like 5' DNA nuclease